MKLEQSSIAFLVAVAVGTAACKSDEPSAGQKAPQPAAAAAPEPAAPAAGDDAPGAAAPAEPKLYQLSASQVGPLGADTPAAADQLGALFPGAEVSAATATAEGSEYEVVEIALAGEPALVVTPGADGNIDRIRITSEQFRMGGGVGVGSTFEELRALGRLACTGGADDYGDSVLCRPESAPTLAFVLSADAGEQYYARPIPAADQGRLLSGEEVTEILWQPAR